MRFLAAAIVTVALCAASFAADAGLADDATGWGVSAGLALVLFAVLVLRGDR